MKNSKIMVTCILLLSGPPACAQDSSIRAITDESQTLRAAVLSAAGDKIYSCYEKGLVRVHASESGKLIREFKVPSDEPEQQQQFWIDVTKDQKQILVGGWRSDLEIWDSEQLVRTGTLDKHFQVVAAFLISPDQSFVFSGDGNGNLHLWDLKKGKRIKSTDHLSRNEHQIRRPISMAFSSDSKSVLLTDLYTSAALWDVEKWALVHRFQGTNSDDRIMCGAVFSYDDKKIITIGFDGNVRVFDRTSKRELSVIQAHKSGMCVASHPKLDRVLSGGQEGKVIYWDLKQQPEKEIARWSFDKAVASVAVSADGKNALCTTRHSMHFWPLPDAGN